MTSYAETSGSRSEGGTLTCGRFKQGLLQSFNGRAGALGGRCRWASLLVGVASCEGCGSVMYKGPCLTTNIRPSVSLSPIQHAKLCKT